jgi:hypothetical protein
MRLAKHGEASGKIGFLTLADRQVPQVHKMLHRQVVAPGQFGCNEFLDLGPQLQLSPVEGIQVLLPGDGRQVFLACLLLGCLSRLLALALCPESLGGN